MRNRDSSLMNLQTFRQVVLERLCNTKWLMILISYYVIDWRQVPLLCQKCFTLPFCDVRLRRNSEFREEDLVFVTMKSENFSPGPWSEMGLDGRH